MGRSPSSRGGWLRYRARVMELNARTTMSHYALAAKRRLGGGDGREPRRFVVARLAELGNLGDDVVCLTDPKTATAFVAYASKDRNDPRKQVTGPPPTQSAPQAAASLT